MNTGENTSRTISPDPSIVDARKALSQLRKWGIQFDGKDPLGFLEHLEELCDAAGYSYQLTMQGLSVLLKGEVLLKGDALL